MMTKMLFILNGPNLNLLGTREPEIYGHDTLDDIEKSCWAHSQKQGLTIDFRQTNSEGELVDWVHEARDAADGLIVNAGAYSHTSIALLDALLAVNKPVIEVHLSNPLRREPFRHHSYVTDASNGLICGLGPQGYLRAIDALHTLLSVQ